MTAPDTAQLMPEVEAYAKTLIASGFTVWLDPNPRTIPGVVRWFHYSKDGHFGTFDLDRFEGPRHRMPIKPSTEYGSAISIGGTWGDTATLGLDTLDPMTAAYAEAVARARNYGDVTGAMHDNVQPWGIGIHYQAVTA